MKVITKYFDNTFYWNMLYLSRSGFFHYHWYVAHYTQPDFFKSKYVMLWNESFTVLYECDKLIVELVVAVYATPKSASAGDCQFKFLCAC